MPIWELAVVFLLVLLNGFFAMSELAVVSSRRARLEQMASEGVKGARAALRLIEEPTRFLSTVQVGITLVGIFAGAYSGATLAGPLGDALSGLMGEVAYPVSVGLVVVGITYLSLVVGELVPKRAAMNNPEKVAARIAPFMRRLSTIGAPIVWLLRVSTEGLVRLLGIPDKPPSTVTEEEVRSMIAEGTQAGIFHAAEQDMIEGVLKLADRSVRSVMTPRLDVVWIDLDDPVEAIQAEIAESGHSRFPAARQSLDEFEGIVHAKDVLNDFARTGVFDVNSSIRQPLVVHEGTHLLRLLEMFRGNPVHMAVIVDEYGVVEGIVTPTDILIAIAGDLPEDVTPADEEAVRREDGSWLMDGMIGIDEAARLLGRRDMRGDGDYETLAGFALAQFGQIPKTADVFAWEGIRFEVVDMDGRRIDRIMVTPEPGEAPHPAGEFLG